MATTQEYAHLSEHVYDRTILVGENPIGRDRAINIGGDDYKILYHANNPITGYQGMIYQKYPDGEIIVAHRGTEPPVTDPLDAKADYNMAKSRTNPQVGDALALVERAQGYAVEQKKWNPDINPSVTITGHSLGGALAEVTAYKFGLYGEAFNGYGAASLNYGVPRGGNNFTNHVMAGDMVSAASPHYGKVVVHATTQDIDVIKQHESQRRQPGSTLSAAADLVGNDHTITNFTGSQRPNILEDAQAISRAQQNASIISHFREDMSNNRWLMSMQSTSPSNIVDGIREKLDDISAQRQHEQLEKHPTTPKTEYKHPVQQMQDFYQQHNQNLNWGAAFGGFRSDATEQLTSPTLASTEQAPAIDRMLEVMAQTPALANLSREAQVAMAQSLMDVAAIPAISNINNTLNSDRVAMIDMPGTIKAVDSPFPVTASLSPNISGMGMTRSDASNHTNSVENESAPSIATVAQAEPIRLPHNIASLHEQITEKFGDKLAHLPEQERDAVIAMSTKAAVSSHAKSVDYIHINEQGKVLMGFDGNIGYSNTVNIHDAPKMDANTVLTASVDLQQTQQQDWAMRQEQSRSQSGPTMSMT